MAVGIDGLSHLCGRGPHPAAGGARLARFRASTGCRSLGALGEHRSPRFAAWAERLWRILPFGGAALAILLALAVPIVGLRTGMPSIKVVPTGDTSASAYNQVQSGVRRRAPGAADRHARLGGGTISAAVKADRARPGHANETTSRRQTRADSGRTLRRAVRSSRRPDHRPAPFQPAAGHARRRFDSREHDFEKALEGHAMGDRDRDDARLLLLLVALQAPIIAWSASHQPGQPAPHSVRAPHLPERPRRRLPRLRIAELPGRLGAGVLLRDDLRHLDGLHGLPARLGEGSTTTAAATRERR